MIDVKESAHVCTFRSWYVMIPSSNGTPLSKHGASDQPTQPRWWFISGESSATACKRPIMIMQSNQINTRVQKHHSQMIFNDGISNRREAIVLVRFHPLTICDLGPKLRFGGIELDWKLNSVPIIKNSKNLPQTNTKQSAKSTTIGSTIKA